MNKSILAILALNVSLIPSVPANAWNQTGHRLIAHVAYDQLDDATRSKVITTLKKHRRFKTDFKKKMPQRIKTADPAIKDRWIFLHAATWPDLARNFKGKIRKKHHHAEWHYINEPLYVSDEDEILFDGDVPVNLNKEWKPRMHARKMNIIQALKKCEDRLKKDGTSGPDQALYSCWLFHLVGDLHQPLHGTALFSSELLPEGDHGGNWIPVKGKNNLHSFWDSAAGTAKTLKGLERKANKWLADNRLKQAGEAAAGKLNFETWLHESNEFANDFVYIDSILEAVAKGKPGTEGHPPKIKPVELSDDYMDTAKDIAAQRVIEAGYRLAAVLKQLNPS